METKFINNTNQQYSIREDGEIIRNYLTSHGKIVYTSKKVKISINNMININTINGRKRFSVPLLLKQYYNGIKCKYCENKVIDKYKTICKDCNLLINKKSTKKAIEKLNKWYIAKTLNINVKNLNEELYIHHKNVILLKRKLAKTHNISILSLNH
jgi:hypothetical protein